jgi:hypothetical protein
LLTLCIVIITSAVYGEIPQIMSYQGKVTDSSGNLVPDGSYTMRFRIYDDETGNTMLWDSGDRSVDLHGGAFDIYLGEMPQNPLDLSFNIDYWLSVTFEGDVQTPRHRLASVGYAYMASGLVPGTEVTGAVTTESSSAIKCVNTATGGPAYGGWFESASGGGTGLYGFASATTGPAHGVYGEAASTEGRGVCGEAWATTGTTYGGRFGSYSTSGTGVSGQAWATTGTTYGVHGRSYSPSGTGVYGVATTTSGVTFGGQFESASQSGMGVYGLTTATSGSTYGGQFVSASTSGTGVKGWATATTGYTHGVRGSTLSSDGIGVSGSASADVGITYGGHFQSSSTSGTGVYGAASATYGTTFGGRFESAAPWGKAVYGLATADSGSAVGVHGETRSSVGYAVYGHATSTHPHISIGGKFVTESPYGVAVLGQGGNEGGLFAGWAVGLYGWAFGNTGETYGVKGNSDSPTGRGVIGQAWAPTGFNYGVLGRSYSSNGTGVCGEAAATTGICFGILGDVVSPSGYGVYGAGGLYAVYSAGDFAASGSKSCVVKTTQGPTLLYCQESPECWFEDFGEGQLVHGRCHVELDPLFLETVTIDEANPMKVFVEPRGPCNGTYIETGLTGFDVVEQKDGTSTVGFCYRIVAKRRGFEQKRLDHCKAALNDSHLYPELRERKLQEYEEERVRMDKERRQREADTMTQAELRSTFE